LESIIQVAQATVAPLLGQFLSRSFVVLLRKSIPQNYNLKTAAELGVREQYEQI